MSETVNGVDARGYLAGWLQAVSGMMAADIQAIPDDKWTATFGGCTRPANMLLADTITNLIWTTETINGIESSAYNEMDAIGAELVDKNVAIAKLMECAGALGAAISGASDEALNRMAMAPWQAEMPVFILAQISVNHVWYHDGQLNYIQSLLGDGDVHWMA